MQKNKLRKGLRKAIKLRDLPRGKQIARIRSNTYPTDVHKE